LENSRFATTEKMKYMQGVRGSNKLFHSLLRPSNSASVLRKLKLLKIEMIIAGIFENLQQKHRIHADYFCLHAWRMAPLSMLEEP
jgi:hypothetical protein